LKVILLYSVVYITASGPGEAETICRTLVEEGLVGCVNSMPITSTYVWDGSVQQDAEVLLLCKTLTDKVKEVVSRVEQLHSYDVPCITHWELNGGSEPYLRWLGELVSI